MGLQRRLDDDDRQLHQQNRAPDLEHSHRNAEEGKEEEEEEEEEEEDEEDEENPSLFFNLTAQQDTHTKQFVAHFFFRTHPHTPPTHV